MNGQVPICTAGGGHQDGIGFIDTSSSFDFLRREMHPDPAMTFGGKTDQPALDVVKCAVQTGVLLDKALICLDTDLQLCKDAVNSSRQAQG